MAVRYVRTMAQMTCPACSFRWESTARSQKTRCGRCRAIVYVPAAVRNANHAAMDRAPGPPRKAEPIPAPAGEIETWELPCRHRVGLRVTWPADDDDPGWEKLGAVVITCPTCRAMTTMSDVLAHAASAPSSTIPELILQTSAARRRSSSTGAAAQAFEPSLPGTWAVRGGLGRWRCGHEMTVPVMLDDSRPEASPCPSCGRRGLVSQRTPQGWAPVVAR